MVIIKESIIHKNVKYFSLDIFTVDENIPIDSLRKEVEILGKNGILNIPKLEKYVIDNMQTFIKYCYDSTIIHDEKVLPNIDSNNYVPIGENLIKSSACVDFSKIDITFRDVFEEEGKVYPSDADFWNRLNKIIINNKYESYCTNKITCIHDEEGYTLTYN